MKYSIVIPCYRSSHTIRQVVTETSKELDRLGRTPYEFILVDDFSPDEGATVRELRAIAADFDCVTVVELARNAGQHNAIMAGLHYADGDIIILMDDDMQTHPSQLNSLLAKFDEEYDVVYGYYPDKKHSAFRNFGSWLNYTTVRVLIGKPKDLRTSSYCLMRKFVRDSIIEYPAQYSHMQGLVLRTVSPERIASVPIQHFERAYGTSTYSFKKLIALWSNIAGFSIVPLRMSRRAGEVLSAVGIIGMIWLVIRKFLNSTKILGWTSTMMAIIFFAGVILITLGILGEYVGRMFLTIGNYPQFVVREVHGQGKTRIAPTRAHAAPTAGPGNTPADGSAENSSGAGSPGGEES